MPASPPKWEHFYIRDARKPVEYIGRYTPGMRFVFNGAVRKRADLWRMRLYSVPYGHSIISTDMVKPAWTSGVEFFDDFIMETYGDQSQRNWAKAHWNDAGAEPQGTARDIAYGFMADMMWEHGGFDFQDNGVDMLVVAGGPGAEFG